MTVALHGFLGAPAMWSGLCDDLVAPWCPGHGPRPAVMEGATFDEVVDRLAAQLLPRDRRVRLVGYSMGARLALAMTLRHPSRVREAVLVGGTPGLRTEAERAARRRDDDALAAALLRDGLPAFVDRWEALPLFATQRDLPAAARAARRAQRLAHDPAALAWCLRALGTGAMPSLWEALPGCEVPLRLVTGGRDEKFTAVARAVVALCPRATHAVVAGAGHDVVTERGVGALPRDGAAHDEAEREG